MLYYTEPVLRGFTEYWKPVHGIQALVVVHCRNENNQSDLLLHYTSDIDSRATGCVALQGQRTKNVVSSRRVYCILF